MYRSVRLKYRHLLSIVLLEATVNIQLIKIKINGFGSFIAFTFYSMYNDK